MGVIEEGKAGLKCTLSPALGSSEDLPPGDSRSMELLDVDPSSPLPPPQTHFGVKELAKASRGAVCYPTLSRGRAAAEEATCSEVALASAFSPRHRSLPWDPQACSGSWVGTEVACPLVGGAGKRTVSRVPCDRE